MRDAANFQSRFSAAVTGQRDWAEFRQPGFAVYRNTWVKALIDALHANYPVVAQLLGPELFEQIAIEYVRKRPSGTPVLALFGQAFPGYLRQHQTADELPYLPDVAALERMWTESLFAPDAEAADLSMVTERSLERALELRPKLHPATRYSRFETPALTIWQAHQGGLEFGELEPDWVPERVLVVRHGGSVRVCPIGQPAWTMLNALQQGQSLGQALEAAACCNPDAELSSVLSEILVAGALTLEPLNEKATF